MMVNFLLIALLILLNGFFAAAEMAFIASRSLRLQQLADEGSKGATLALEEKENASDFLATVQVGVTLVATLASALGGANVAAQITPLLTPLFGTFAPQIALALIVIAIAYTTLVIGELVPKQIALHSPEAFVSRVMRPLHAFQRVAWLPIRFLNGSSQLVLRLFHIDGTLENDISAAEVRHVLKAAASVGEITPIEDQLISKVFSYSSRVVADVMTAHPAVVTLRNDDTVAAAVGKAQKSGLSRFPIIVGDDLDSATGYVHVKDLLGQEETTAVHTLQRKTLYLPDSLTLPRALTQLKQTETHLAFVVDEFGGIVGVVTVEDIVEEIVGEIEDEYGELLNTSVQKDDNRWSVDGTTSIHDVEQMIGHKLPQDSHYTTIAGLMIAHLGHLPRHSDQMTIDDYTFRVAEIDGRRIAQIIIRRQA